MRLTVIGSSDAFNACGRLHSCYWLEAAGAGPIMVDFGATALAGLRLAGKHPDALRGVAITHLHGDHIGGLPFLFINGMYNDVRTTPLEIVGPAHATERVEALYALAYPSVSQRERPYNVAWREVSPGARVDLAGFTLETFAASHQDLPEVPLCLRLTSPDGAVVAFSGDTELCPGLFAAADGADLLVAECTAVRPPAGRHATWVEWREALPDVGAAAVLLTHLNDEMRGRLDACLAEAPSDGPPLSFADDRMVIDIPTRRETRP